MANSHKNSWTGSNRHLKVERGRNLAYFYQKYIRQKNIATCQLVVFLIWTVFGKVGLDSVLGPDNTDTKAHEGLLLLNNDIK